MNYIDRAIESIESFYMENCIGMSIEDVFIIFDTIAALKEMKRGGYECQAEKH